MEHDEIKRVSKELEELLEIFPKEETTEEAEREIQPETKLKLELGGMKLIEVIEDEPEVSLKEQRKIRKSRNQKKAKNEYQPEKNYIRSSDGLMAAFFVPVVIMIIIFAQRGIFPFGEESFLRTDMYHQYAPFFSEFRNKITNGGSLLYSWNMGMGVNFAALYAYYLASPLNWLLILCPKGLIIEFMTYSIVLKIGLSGLTFAYYLRKHSDTSDFGIAFFGIFYALSGYMAAYSWNIMWLDCILLFPLIVLGLESLVKEKKCLLYCITLGISILSNYYISIMICIFMVIYFICLLILETNKSWKDYAWNVIHFGIYSLAAGGLAAVVLLPEIYALQVTASGDINFPKTVTSYFSIFDMIARHIGNIDIEIGLDHWPNIYCGVAILMLFLLYLVCEKIAIKEKVIYCGLLLFFFASFSTNMLNFIWHGFHYPNSLPCRQSFIYIFLILTMGYRVYMYLKDTSWKHIVFAFWGSVCFVILAEKLVEQEHFKFYVYYIAILFLAIYTGLMYLYKKRKLNINLLAVLALAVVAVEASVNTTITSVTTTGRTAYIKDNEDVNILTNSLLPADTFYRIEKVTRKTKNDGAWMNFPSVSLFSSTANANLTSFFKSVGCEGNTNAYSITGSTPLVDSLFSVRYGLYSEEQSKENLIFTKQSGDTYLYERKYTLPLGFMIDRSLEENWQRDLKNPASVQNDLCDVIGADRVLIDAGGEVSGSTFRFTPEISGDYYIYVTNKKVEDVTVSKNEDSQTFKNVNRGYILEVGFCEAGEEVTLKAGKEDQTMEAKAYLFSYSSLELVYEVLNEKPLTVTKWTDAFIEGVVNVEEAGTLFTSIPYDKGWNIWVDGAEWRGNEIFGTFLSLDLPHGTHTITLKYKPEGLQLGIYITLGSLLLLLVLAGIDYLTRRKQEEGFIEIQENEQEEEN